MLLRVSEIPLSGLSELRPMERFHGPGSSCTVKTVASVQLDPNTSTPKFEFLHLHPSTIHTCIPALKCLGKGREAPGCSCSSPETHSVKMRLPSGGQKLSSVLSSSDSTKWLLTADIDTKNISDGELGLWKTETV